MLDAHPIENYLAYNANNAELGKPSLGEQTATCFRGVYNLWWGDRRQTVHTIQK